MGRLNALRAALLLGCAACSTLHAADGLYLGGGVGAATVRDNLDTGGTFDADDISYRAFAGWRFNAVPIVDLAVEAAYTDFGRPSQSGSQIKLHGPSVAGLLILPLGPLDLYGKAGALDWKYDRTTAGASTTKSGTTGFWGAGIGFYLWKLGFRAEYERFQIRDVDRVQMFSLNALVQF